jgi:hypothetical protein
MLFVAEALRPVYRNSKDIQGKKPWLSLETLLGVIGTLSKEIFQGNPGNGGRTRTTV